MESSIQNQFLSHLRVDDESSAIFDVFYWGVRDSLLFLGMLRSFSHFIFEYFILQFLMENLCFHRKSEPIHLQYLTFITVYYEFVFNLL